MEGFTVCACYYLNLSSHEDINYDPQSPTNERQYCREDHEITCRYMTWGQFDN